MAPIGRPTPAASWEEVRGADYLWSDEMADVLTKALQGQSDTGRDRAAAQLDVLSKLLQLEGRTQPKPSPDRQKAAKQAEAILSAVPAEEAPDPGDQLPIVLEQVPTARSCVTSLGPYNQWGGDTSSTSGELSRPLRIAAITTPAPRVLHARIQIVNDFGGASAESLRGTGCWFTVSRSGVARLDLEFVFNAHNTVFGGVGFADGEILVGGSVWGQAENRWVDRGGALVDISHLQYYGAQSFSAGSNGRRLLSISFDAVAGRPYYCAGRISISGLAFHAGLPSLLPAMVGVEMAATLNPLRVCID